MARVLAAGPWLLYLGRLRQLRQLPAGARRRTGLYFSQAIIWVKEHPVLTRKDFMGNHEWCFYGWREGAAHQFFGPNNATDVWRVKKVNPQSMVHLTEKPVELAVRAIAVLVAAGRERPRSVRRQRLDADRRRTDRSAGVPDGTRPALLRRHRSALGSLYR